MNKLRLITSDLIQDLTKLSADVSSIFFVHCVRNKHKNYNIHICFN